MKAGYQDLCLFCVLYELYFNVYFGKSVMTFNDVGEIAFMSIP